eukprot:1158429-Pelagomonas_calceolata.AAC.3
MTAHSRSCRWTSLQNNNWNLHAFCKFAAEALCLMGRHEASPATRDRWPPYGLSPEELHAKFGWCSNQQGAPAIRGIQHCLVASIRRAALQIPPAVRHVHLMPHLLV